MPNLPPKTANSKFNKNVKCPARPESDCPHINSYLKKKPFLRPPTASQTMPPTNASNRFPNLFFVLIDKKYQKIYMKSETDGATTLPRPICPHGYARDVRRPSACVHLVRVVHKPPACGLPCALPCGQSPLWLHPVINLQKNLSEFVHFSILRKSTNHANIPLQAISANCSSSKLSEAAVQFRTAGLSVAKRTLKNQ